MSRNHFDAILQVLSFTDLDPPQLCGQVLGGMTNVEGMGVKHGFMFYAWVGKLSG